MKIPDITRTSKESESAKREISKDLQSALLVRTNSILKQQFETVAKFKGSNMNKEIIKFMESYVKKHYKEVLQWMGDRDTLT